MNKVSSYENLQNDVRKIELPEIETWTNQYTDRDYDIDMSIPEFTCICPKTGLPDFADIKIQYSPNEKCLELKSLKEYIIAYRNVGIFHEHLTNRILDDLVRTCSPKWMRVEAEMNPRGGVYTTVSAEYSEK